MSTRSQIKNKLSTLGSSAVPPLGWVSERSRSRSDSPTKATQHLGWKYPRQ